MVILALKWALHYFFTVGKTTILLVVRQKKMHTHIRISIERSLPTQLDTLKVSSWIVKIVCHTIYQCLF